MGDAATDVWVEDDEVDPVGDLALLQPAAAPTQGKFCAVVVQAWRRVR